jgi:hypothetical protein
MRQLASIVTFACALAGIAPAQSGLPLIQPDAGVVFGIEWRRMLDSAAGAKLVEQIKKNDLAKIPGFQGLQDALLHDVDSILIAAPASEIAKGSPQASGLMVVKGRFEADRLRSMFTATGGRPETYRAVELFGSPQNAPGSAAGNKNSVFGVLDGTTLLAGDRAQVRAAVDRVKSGRLAQSHTGVLAGVADLAANNDIWMIAAIPPSATKDLQQPMGQMLANVRSTDFGMSFRDGLAVRMNVRAKDAPSATQVFQTIQGLIGMAALSQNQNPQATDMLRKINITSEGAQVKLALSLDQGELDKMIQEAQTARATPAARPAPATNGIRPPEPPKPGTVRITGLDSGPVELPLSTLKK